LTALVGALMAETAVSMYRQCWAS